MKAEQIRNGTKNGSGLVWCDDRWLTPEFYLMVAPLSDLCPELEPPSQAQFYDPDPTAKLD